MLDQVRGKAAACPTLLRRLLVLLDQIERAAAGTGLDCSEVEKQRELIIEGARRDAPTTRTRTPRRWLSPSALGGAAR